MRYSQNYGYRYGRTFCVTGHGLHSASELRWAALGCRSAVVMMQAGESGNSNPTESTLLDLTWPGLAWHNLAWPDPVDAASRPLASHAEPFVWRAAAPLM
jgi:hypothetical protein